jgi:ketosteroid isomerase-like protein
MSQENVEVVRRVAEALNRRDVAGIVEEVSPEVEWHPAMQALVGGATVYRGPEGVREMMRDFYDTFADVHLEVLETRESGDRVVLVGHIRVRGKVSGADAESPAAYVVSLRNGKVIRVRTYLDPDEALDASA